MSVFFVFLACFLVRDPGLGICFQVDVEIIVVYSMRNPVVYRTAKKVVFC